MATEKPAAEERSPRTEGFSAQAQLRKALIKNLTSKAAPDPGLRPGLHTLKYLSVRDLKAKPELRLAPDNSPFSAKRTAETTPGSVRGKTQAPLDFPQSLNGSRLNISLETPRKRLAINHSRSIECADLKPTYPLTPVQAVKMHLAQLTEYERREILGFPQIYYLGLEANKIQGGAGLPNFGFDDKKGDYALVSKDQIQYRYEVLDLLGQGSFGKVCRCFDHKTKDHVAVKILRNRKRFHQQGQIERSILERLRQQDPDDKLCVVKVKNSFQWRDHLCFSFELLAANLYDFLKINDFAGLSGSLIRKFAIQLVIALRFLKGNHIIHCDLKPENILLKTSSRSAIKVIDFGSACLDTERIYTYIQSRFYRAPEIVLGLPYSAAIDMWSLGCILAELHLGYPLFPGESEQEQLACIMEVLGVPPEPVLSQATRRKLFFDSQNAPRIKANSRGKRRIPASKSLESLLHVSDPAFLDFISRCLTWQAADRLTPDLALKHVWVQEGIHKAREASCTRRLQSDKTLRTK